MLLTAHYVMRLLVPSAREATIHPFAHQGLANCRSAADRCRPVTRRSLLAHRKPLYPPLKPQWTGACLRPGGGSLTGQRPSPLGLTPCCAVLRRARVSFNPRKQPAPPKGVTPSA